MTELNTIEDLKEKVVNTYNKLSPKIKKENPAKMAELDIYANMVNKYFKIINSESTNSEEKEKYKQKYSNLLNTLDSELKECNARYCSA